MASVIQLSGHLDGLETTLGITDAQLAQIVGTDRRTVRRWRAGETFPQHDSRERLAALGDLVRRLGESFGSSPGAHRWLHTESGYFGGLRPIDALLSGRVDRVEAALEALDAGVFV